MSDTISISSGSMGENALGGVVIEEVGQIGLSQLGDFLPRKVVLLNYTLAALSDDGARLLLGELRTREGGQREREGDPGWCQARFRGRPFQGRDPLYRCAVLEGFLSFDNLINSLSGQSLCLAWVQSIFRYLPYHWSRET